MLGMNWLGGLVVWLERCWGAEDGARSRSSWLLVVRRVVFVKGRVRVSEVRRMVEGDGRRMRCIICEDIVVVVYFWGREEMSEY